MPGGENILDFLQLRQVLSTYDGDRRDPLWWPQERPVKIQDTLERERHHERLPSNSYGDWPFLRPPERVPEVPVGSREHLPQLEKIQEIPPPGEMRTICAEASGG